MKQVKLIEYEEPKTWADIPWATCSEAGILITKNAGWRNERPVIDPKKCIGCGQCYLYCPDGVISFAEGEVSIDYDFCKGCGICSGICRRGAIRMEEER
ncbi:pyruvate:ferredoxin oxidoreductase, delta subunit [Lachnospiraceae bacterium KM106-2]|nr:pyruvate:ferredoxin oxidoreductase, delta subunit [Lachnospiraceae bacterium KM106-2]